MNITDMAKIVGERSRPLGHQRRGQLFWRGGDELTTLIHLQKSRWHKGFYVNFGVTPNGMVTKDVPPGTGYLGIQLRPTSWEHRFFDLFCRCESDEVEAVTAEEITPAVRWLLEWMEKHLEEGKVRADVRNRRSWLSRTGPVKVMMKDWAAGKLADPPEYFSVPTPYYG